MSKSEQSEGQCVPSTIFTPDGQDKKPRSRWGASSCSDIRVVITAMGPDGKNLGEKTPA